MTHATSVPTNPFQGLAQGDTAGQFDALRSLLRALHGVALVPSISVRAKTRSQAQSLGITPGEELGQTLDLLSDMAASDDLDTLLWDKGTIRGGQHPYQFVLEPLQDITPSVDALAIFKTKDLESYFAVDAKDETQSPCRLKVYERHSAKATSLNEAHLHGHTSLLSWLVKLLVPRDLGQSLMFTNYIDDVDVAGLHSSATALMGAPVPLGPDAVLYMGANVIMTLRGRHEPIMDLWVLDIAKDWPRDDGLLQAIQLTEPALAKWRDEILAKSGGRPTGLSPA